MRRTLSASGRARIAFADVLAEVVAGYELHRLCGYLYRLAQTFTTFYERCPVLRATGTRRANRLALCRLTGDTLRTGLHLLGIPAPPNCDPPPARSC